MFVKYIDLVSLDGVCSGDLDGLHDALNDGANAKLGISFMFKVHHLFDPSVTVPMIKLLQEVVQSQSNTLL